MGEVGCGCVSIIIFCIILFLICAYFFGWAFTLLFPVILIAAGITFVCWVIERIINYLKDLF